MINSEYGFFICATLLVMVCVGLWQAVVWAVKNKDRAEDNTAECDDCNEIFHKQDITPVERKCGRRDVCEWCKAKHF